MVVFDPNKPTSFTPSAVNWNASFTTHHLYTFFEKKKIENFRTTICTLFGFVINVLHKFTEVK